MAVDAVNTIVKLSNISTNNLSKNMMNLSDLTEMTTITTASISTSTTSNASTLVKSPSFLYINDLILSSNPIENNYFLKRCPEIRLYENDNIKNTSTLSTTTNGYYNENNHHHHHHHRHHRHNHQPEHNLTINKVGSYVELRLKRTSVGKCFFGNREDDDLDEANVNTNNKNKEKFPSRFCRGRKLNQEITASYSSLSRSRSSSASSSSSFSSIFAGDSSFRKKKSSNKKIKLSNNNCDITTTNNLEQTISNLNKNKLKSMKMVKKKAKNKTKIRTATNSANISKCKNTKHNKFSKLNEDCLSKSYVVASSISNFSLANTNNLNANKLKCLLVGDAHIGKSALMCLFLKRIFQTEYQPTIVDNCEGK